MSAIGFQTTVKTLSNCEVDGVVVRTSIAQFWAYPEFTLDTHVGLGCIDLMIRNTQPIDELVSHFYASFNNVDGALLELQWLQNLFTSNATISKVGDEIEALSVASFIQPRQDLLNSGVVTDFSEYELRHKTVVFGGIAQRFSHYEKKGIQNGAPFVGHGAKSFQFLQQDNIWKISSLVWQDANEELQLPNEIT